MSKNLYVGNLSYSVDNRELENLFAPHGVVARWAMPSLRQVIN